MAALTGSAGQCGVKAARAVQSSFSIIKYFDSSTKNQTTKNTKQHTVSLLKHEYQYSFLIEAFLLKQLNPIYT